ncbi:hypothetical protein FXO38_05929 [Capsicum annuum]|nr:hypothetical protein FXO38_05929 [Capsicum annuum]KAF3675363.1 hypothetical protein FXO37_05911 [Capsicum annuum]
MSLFQNWVICADNFGEKLPFPVPAIKRNKNENKNKTDSTDNSKNIALTMTPTFDGLFHFETMEKNKEKKKNADSTDAETAKTLNIRAASDNAVVGASKKDNRSKNRTLVYNPAFDGLFPFEAYVYR